METRHEDSDGSDIFWPGYVDAVTNLVLNLLFLLTIMTVAVFMFALELGRASHNVLSPPPVVATKQEGKSLPKTGADSVKENIALKLEIERLKAELAQRVAQPGQSVKETGRLAQPGLGGKSGQAGNGGAGIEPAGTAKAGMERAGVERSGTVKAGTERAGTELAVSAKAGIERVGTERPGTTKAGSERPGTEPAGTENAGTAQAGGGRAGLSGQLGQVGGLVKTVEATSVASKPLNGLAQTQASEFEIIVRFLDDAVALTSVEHDRLLETLKPVVARGKASINVEVPLGFSEAKRMGFYRAMAVRNVLIEMKMPKDQINVLVVEGKNNANASVVKIR
jgi:hypothetical protein